MGRRNGALAGLPTCQAGNAAASDSNISDPHMPFPTPRRGLPPRVNMLAFWATIAQNGGLAVACGPGEARAGTGLGRVGCAQPAFGLIRTF